MITPFNIFVIQGGGFMIPYENKTKKLMVLPMLLMMMMMTMTMTMMMMMMMVMIVSVQQRPSWTEHVKTTMQRIVPISLQ